MSKQDHTHKYYRVLVGSRKIVIKNGKRYLEKGEEERFSNVLFRAAQHSSSKNLSSAIRVSAGLVVRS